MSMFSRLLATTAAAALLVGSSAQAAVLTGALTADNEFNAYISTSDAVLGTLVATGADWTTAYNFTTNLEAGQTYYLHVVANNWYGQSNMGGGNPDAFLGSFSLSGLTHAFSNGLQTLNTDTVNWRVDPHAFQALNNITDWVAPTGTPDVWANNSDTNSIWYQNHGGPIAGVSPSADWIWSHNDPGGEALFSTTISAVAVPEPTTWGLMIIGFGGIGAVIRHRRRQTALA
jgi:MSHA biogenesis protein MshQ